MLDFIRGFISIPLVVVAIIFIVWGTYGFKEIESPAQHPMWGVGLAMWIPLAIVGLLFIAFKKL